MLSIGVVSAALQEHNHDCHSLEFEESVGGHNEDDDIGRTM
jgi:hypothetical protein